MYNILVHLHSINRWVILVLLLAAIVKAFQGWFGKKEFKESDRKVALFASIATHTQFLIGLWLYFISPFVTFETGFMKNGLLRFYTVEHFTMMIIAIVLIALGFSLSKRAKVDVTKFKRIAVFYTLGLVIMLASIPWPFRFENAGWF